MAKKSTPQETINFKLLMTVGFIAALSSGRIRRSSFLVPIPRLAGPWNTFNAPYNSWRFCLWSPNSDPHYTTQCHESLLTKALLQSTLIWLQGLAWEARCTLHQGAFMSPFSDILLFAKTNSWARGEQ